MFYAVPRPTRDGSKVNVGRPGPGGSSGVVWKQELGGGEEGEQQQQRPRASVDGGQRRAWKKRSGRKKERSGGTIGGREGEGGTEGGRKELEECAERKVRRDGIGRCYCGPPRGTPIARMRAKVKLRQVVTLLLPLSLPRHETMRIPVACTVLLLFLFSARLLRTPLPRGHVLPARDDLRLWGPHRDRPIGCEATPFVACVGRARACFGGCPHTIRRSSRSDNFLDELLTKRSPVFPSRFLVLVTCVSF